MGRVRRYKKIKACDPFAKKKKTEEVDDKHDDNPFERRNKKKRKFNHEESDEMPEKRTFYFADEEDDVTEKPAPAPVKVEMPKFEAIREGESLKSYKRRIQSQTTKILTNEIPKFSASVQKKKLKLKELAQKRKLKKKAKIEEDENQVNFSSRNRRRSNSSDEEESTNGDTLTTKKVDKVAFGEQVTEPPKLQEFVKKMQEMQQKNFFKTKAEKMSTMSKSMSNPSHRFGR